MADIPHAASLETRVDTGVATTREHADGRSPVQELLRLVAEHERRDAILKDHYAARLEVSTAQARLSALDAAAERTTLAHVAFRRALDGVYRDPDQTRRAFMATAAERGIDVAVHTLRERPERLGALAAIEHRIAFGLLPYRNTGPARARAAAASTYGRAAVLAEHQLRQVVTDVQARRLAMDGAPELRTVAQFEHALAIIYQDPAAARRAFETLANHAGAERAAAHFLDHPWLYAPLRAGADEDRPYPDAQARAAALGVEALRAARMLPPAETRIAREISALQIVAAERAASHAVVERALQREHELASRVARLPSAPGVEHQIRQMLRRLTPEEHRQVHALLSMTQRALVAKLLETSREVLMGRER
jgi:hypothetical protein